MDERQKALDRLKQSAQLATDFARDHPNSGIKTVEDFHRYVQNNSGIVESWAQNKKVGVADLASAFNDAESLDRISNLRQEEPEKSQKNPFAGLSGLAAAPLARFIETDDVKLAQVALTEPSPEVNLYQFIPTEIAADQEFQVELGKVRDPYVEGLRKQNPKISQGEIDEKLANLDDQFKQQAINAYRNSSGRADKINKAREHDIYLKDANGNIVGEKIFKDKKGRADPHFDPVYLSYQRQKQAAIAAALKKNEADRKNKIKPKHSDADTSRIIEMQYDGHFASLFPEKAAAYAKTHGGLETNTRTLKKAEKKLQKKEEKEEKRTQKTAREYQEEWNDQKITAAKIDGYDPSELSRNIQDRKEWETRSWKDKEEEEGKEKNQENKKKSPRRQNQPVITENKQQRSQREYEESTRGSFFEGTNFPDRKFISDVRSRVFNKVNKRLGRRFGNAPARTATRAALSTARNVGSQLTKKAASQAIQAGAKALIANPYVLAAIGIILLIIIVVVTIIVLVSGGEGDGGEFAGGTPPGGEQPPVNSNPIPGFTLTKSVSVTEILVVGEEQITYTISYTSDNSIPLESITVYDTIPQNTNLVQGSVTGNYTINSAKNTISWSLSEPENQSLSSFSFSVLPSGTNIEISNYAWAESSAEGSNLTSSENCSGYYSLDNPKGNFGDPSCSFANNNAQAKNDLYTLLKSQDPTNADYWYLKIIPCESGYNPNAYLSASTSGLGAYGLYQMNPSGSANGVYDSGDVNWPQQTSNAINYNKQINGTFAYWACK